jgi:hypothetical protein
MFPDVCHFHTILPVIFLNGMDAEEGREVSKRENKS